MLNPDDQISQAIGVARPNRFDIDLGAIGQFTREIRNYVGSSVRLFATLKCNAYGFGLEPVSRTVLASGADALSMVDMSDAVRLRQAGISAPILVYPGAVVDDTYVRAAERHNLIPTITSLDAARMYSQRATGPLKVAVKLDVGQERLGILAEEAGEALLAISRMPKLTIEIVNAHPNVPASAPVAYLEWQLARFQAACANASARGVNIPVRMLASSKILSITKGLTLNGVDPGQMYFGPLKAEGDVPWPTRRQGIKRVSSRIIHVRTVDREAYRDMAPFPTEGPIVMGVVPIGSADGIAQVHCGSVLVRGQRARIIGKPSLEHTRIDLSGIRNPEVGDEVVFIGQQRDAQITPEEVAAYQGHGRVADLAIALRAHVPRFYAE